MRKLKDIGNYYKTLIQMDVVKGGFYAVVKRRGQIHRLLNFGTLDAIQARIKEIRTK